MNRSRSMPRSSTGVGSNAPGNRPKGSVRLMSAHPQQSHNHNTAPSMATGSLKVYGDIYSSYELPGTKIYRNNDIHHGLVLISDGKGMGHPARLELSHDTLAIQIPLAFGEFDPEAAGLGGAIERRVTLRRQADGGFGFSIKGGANGSYKVPILISNVYKQMMPSENENDHVFVGDAILQINGVEVSNKSHDEVVEMMRDAPDEILLKVKHQKGMAYFLRRGSIGSSSGGGTMNSRVLSTTDASTIRSSTYFGMQNAQYPSTTGSDREVPRGWRTFVKLPLPMAYVTRYLLGTDKLRPNGFEIRAVDGTSSGIIHCEDGKVVDQWFNYICNNIVRLNNKSIKLSNKFLHPDELIVYLGWVCEKLREPPAHEFWQTWEPRFLILKGSDVCFFENPPLNTEDLEKCIVSYKVMETRFKDLKEEQRKDNRENAFVVETAAATTHYLSTESLNQLLQLRGAFHRATYYAVNRLQARTFACSVDGRPSGVVFDLRYGVGLYDIPLKKYLWKHKFSHLVQSSDDGKMRVRLVFKRATKNVSSGDELRIVDIDCSETLQMVYCLHSFFLSRLLGVDPDFLEYKTTPKTSPITTLTFVNKSATMAAK